MGGYLEGINHDKSNYEMEEPDVDFFPSMQFVYLFLQSLVWYSVRTPYNFDFELTSILGCLKIHIPRLEFGIINSIQVYLRLRSIKGILDGVYSNRFQYETSMDAFKSPTSFEESWKTDSQSSVSSDGYGIESNNYCSIDVEEFYD